MQNVPNVAGLLMLW